MFQPPLSQCSYPYSYRSSPVSNIYDLGEVNFDYQISSASRAQQLGQTLNNLRSDHSSHAVPTPTSSTLTPYNYHNHHHQRIVEIPNRMNDSGIAYDITTQQEGANDYEADLVGPLVGHKKSSHAITEEYAKADPVFVAKTIALPQTYSHFRSIIGDGNCGWRAIAFCYFETLQQLGSISQIEDELGRMLSMGNFIQNATGYPSMIYEDMQQAVLDLLQELVDKAQTNQGQTDTLILDNLNNPEISNSIVYYMRLLTSSWMETHPQDYAPFIEVMSVENYRKNVIEPVNCEIEHVGMKALVDVLLKPIGISVEVVYLDRSPGSQVNTVPMQATDSARNFVVVGEPTAYLLYRPGHYDILYKQPVSASLYQDAIQSHITDNSNMEIRRVNSIGYQDAQWTAAPSCGSEFDVALLASIPGMSFVGAQPGFGNYDTTPVYKSSFYDLSSQSTSIGTQRHPSAHSSSSRSSNSVASTPYLEISSAPPAHNRFSMSNQSNIHSSRSVLAPASTIMSSPSDLCCTNAPGPISSNNVQQSPTHPIRRSRYEVEREYEHPPPPPLQTSTFKNSHYNVAHFNNPDFQPEEWKPEDEPDDVFRASKTGKIS